MESQICMKYTLDFRIDQESSKGIQKRSRNQRIFNKPDFHTSNLANETHVGYEKHLSGQKKRV